MRLRRLFLIRFLAAIAAFSFLSVNLLFPQPTYAVFSSLDTPDGAKIAALESSYVAAPTAASETAASASIGSATSSGSYVGEGFAGVTAAGLAIAGLTAAGVNSLQDLAAQKYCAANASAGVCGYISSNQALSDVISLSTTSVTGHWVNSNCGVNTSFTSTYDLTPGSTTIGKVLFPPGGSSCQAYYVVPIGWKGFGVPMDWNQWDAQSRSDAVNLLTGDDYKNNLSESSPVAIPSSSDSTLNVSGSNLVGTFYQDSSGVWHYIPGNPVTIPNPTPSPG